MLDKKDLIKKLEKDIKNTQNKIEHHQSYNLKAYIATLILKSGIALDYAFPFILSATILFNIAQSKGCSPYFKDITEQKAKVKITNTSSDYYNEITSFDNEYNEEATFEHSTKWTLNKYGLFERTITSYKLDESIDLNNQEKILKMTKEEVEKAFKIINIKKIQKSVLETEDEIYYEDMLIITSVIDSEEQVNIKEQSVAENIIETISYLVLVTLFGFFIKKIGRIFIKTTIEDKLNEQIPKFRPISSKELSTLKEILETKKSNLAMLDESIENIEESNNKKYVRKK